jgi:hypothetical protein
MKYSLRSLMIVFTLVCVYLGAYSANLDALEVNVRLHGVASHYRDPRFRVGDTVSQFVFRPVVCIDQMLRPEYWELAP